MSLIKRYTYSYTHSCTVCHWIYVVSDVHVGRLSVNGGSIIIWQEQTVKKLHANSENE